MEMERPERPSRPEKVSRIQGFLRHRTRLRIISSDSESDTEVEIPRPSRVHNSQIGSTTSRLWKSVHGVHVPPSMPACFLGGYPYIPPPHHKSTPMVATSEHPATWTPLMSSEIPSRRMHRRRLHSEMAQPPLMTDPDEGHPTIIPTPRRGSKRMCLNPSNRSSSTPRGSFQERFPEFCSSPSTSHNNSLRLVNVQSLMPLSSELNNENESAEPTSSINLTESVEPLVNGMSHSMSLDVEEETSTHGVQESALSLVVPSSSQNGNNTITTGSINCPIQCVSALGDSRTSSVSNNAGSSSSDIVILADPPNYEIQETIPPKRSGDTLTIVLSRSMSREPDREESSTQGVQESALSLIVPSSSQNGSNTITTGSITCPLQCASTSGDNRTNTASNNAASRNNSSIIILPDTHIGCTRFKYPDLVSSAASQQNGEEFNRNQSSLLKAINEIRFAPTSLLLDNLNINSCSYDSSDQTLQSPGDEEVSPSLDTVPIVRTHVLTPLALSASTSEGSQSRNANGEEVIIIHGLDLETGQTTETTEIVINDRERDFVVPEINSANPSLASAVMAAVQMEEANGTVMSGEVAANEVVDNVLATPTSALAVLSDMQQLDISTNNTEATENGADGNRFLITKDFHAKMMSLLECPVCLDVIIPPIHQCKQGHLVCSTCRPKLNVCPTCRSRFSDYRNIIMEKVADLLLFPCKNSSLGCTGTYHYHDKIDHEMWCNYRQYSCVVSSCSWHGFKQELVVHMLSDHPQKVIVGNDTIFKLSFDQNNESQWVMSALDEVFIITFLIVAGNIKGTVKYLGDFDKAKKFKYQISFRGKNNGQELIWKERTYPDSSSPLPLTTLLDCSLVHTIFKSPSSHFVNRHSIQHVDVQVTVEPETNN